MQDLRTDKQTRADLFDNVHFIWSIRRNLIFTYQFHRWFQEHRDDEEKLDEMTKMVVKDFHDKKKEW